MNNVKGNENEPLQDSVSEPAEKKAETSEVIGELLKMYPGAKDTLLKVLFGVTSTAVKLASKATEVQAKVEKAFSGMPEQTKLMEEAGAYLKDLREVAGLTVKELSDNLKLPDQSLLTAVEKGTAAVSFELILRLASLLARHDPVPFVIKLVRTYNPEVWSLLEDWGIGRLPLHIERERQFLNIYRSIDAARSLSDDDFKRVLEFTKAAFDMAFAFAAGNKGEGSKK